MLQTEAKVFSFDFSFKIAFTLMPKTGIKLHNKTFTMKGLKKIDEAYAGIFFKEEQVNSACFSWLDLVSSGFDMVKVLFSF